MAKTDWKFNDIVTETDMNELGQEVNEAKAELGDMESVPTEAKDAAGAIGELHTKKLDKSGGKMTGALFVETAAREISAGSWADMSANSTGYALFAQNCYTANNNEYRYSNTHASLGARGIRFNHTSASVEYFDTGAIATTADVAFTPNWISMRPDAAATANRTILRDASGRGKVAPPVAADDIARLDTVQTFGYGTTSGTGSAYTAAIGLVAALTEGLRVTIKLHAASGANPTLNINGLGAKGILKPSGSAPTAGLLKAGSIYTLVYNGSAFTLQGEGGEYGTAVAAEVLAGKTIGTESGLVTGTMPNYSRAALGEGYTLAQSIKVDSMGNLVIEPKTGFYTTGLNGAGFGTVLIYDPDFIATNIRQGVDIFGLLGTMPVGYKIVAGTVTNGSITTSNRFPSYGGGSDGGYIVEITGHNVTPRIVLLMNNAFYGGYTLYCEELVPDTISGYPIRSRQNNATRTDFSKHANLNDFTSSYICLPSWFSDTTFKYIIIGQ
ncbi:hypothetical protein [Paenibacillus sp. KS-LC4]|uniref:hypothetical protein n=1 Tax=Paenibacillus sp. KS-LC4 TaxID=2979727 RepID=UPI0030CF73C1